MDHFESTDVVCELPQPDAERRPRHDISGPFDGETTALGHNDTQGNLTTSRMLFPTTPCSDERPMLRMKEFLTISMITNSLSYANQ